MCLGAAYYLPTPANRLAFTGEAKMYAQSRKEYTAAELAAMQLDCTRQMRNESNGEDFVLVMEDTFAWGEYSQVLTKSELRGCWKQATKPAPLSAEAMRKQQSDARRMKAIKSRIGSLYQPPSV